MTMGTMGTMRAMSLARVMLSILALSSSTAAWADGQDFSTLSASPYDASISSADARFGAQLGAGSQWTSQAPASGTTMGTIAFGGNASLGCSGIDLNGFLRSFDPAELITEIRNSLLTGAQAAASNYLIMLAYANPTISSVLDMMDKRYTARYSSLAQACDAQAARARGQDRGARAMALSGDQCFAQETSRGTAPTEAYRRCSIQNSFDGLDLPATASTLDYLRRYTHVNVTPALEPLFALLPDERIQGGRYQMRPPLTTVAAMSGRLKIQARAALDKLDQGADPATIAPCDAGRLLNSMQQPDGCLPVGTATLVTSSAFRSSRLLGLAARNLFKDALAAQIALASMYSNLLELYQQSAQIDVLAGTTADAAHAATRRSQLRAGIAELLGEADAQVKAQAARSELVRMQMLALEQVEANLDTGARRLQENARPPGFELRDLISAFADDH